MRKIKSESKPQRPVRDGVPIVVRFRDHKQLELIVAAAQRRGVARDRFIQDVLEAAAELVLAAPPPPTLAEIARAIVAEPGSASSTL